MTAVCLYKVCAGLVLHSVLGPCACTCTCFCSRPVAIICTCASMSLAFIIAALHLQWNLSACTCMCTCNRMCTTSRPVCDDELPHDAPMAWCTSWTLLLLPLTSSQVRSHMVRGFTVICGCAKRCCATCTVGSLALLLMPCRSLFTQRGSSRHQTIDVRLQAGGAAEATGEDWAPRMGGSVPPMGQRQPLQTAQLKGWTVEGKPSCSSGQCYQAPH